LGYIWELPYVNGTSSVNSITIDSAISLAREVGAIIEFDETSQTPYFTFEKLGIQYIVWFINAITIDSLAKLISKKDISGLVIWNITTFYPQLWLVTNSQYNTVKLLPEF
jgi:spore germination protein